MRTFAEFEEEAEGIPSVNALREKKSNGEKAEEKPDDQKPIDRPKKEWQRFCCKQHGVDHSADTCPLKEAIAAATERVVEESKKKEVRATARATRDDDESDDEIRENVSKCVRPTWKNQSIVESGYVSRFWKPSFQ